MITAISGRLQWFYTVLIFLIRIVYDSVFIFYEQIQNTIFSFILWSVVYIFIRCAPSKCPKCKRDLEKPEWKQETCPGCGEFTEVRQPKPRIIKYVGPLSFIIAIITTVVIFPFRDWDIYPLENIFRMFLFVPFFFFIVYIPIRFVVFVLDKRQYNK